MDIVDRYKNIKEINFNAQTKQLVIFYEESKIEFEVVSPN